MLAIMTASRRRGALEDCQLLIAVHVSGPCPGWGGPLALFAPLVRAA